MNWLSSYARPELARRYQEAVESAAPDGSGCATTNLPNAAAYFDTISSIVSFFGSSQSECGAILDPTDAREWFYSTPCFALAAAVLVKHGREDLRPSAERAVEWASVRLALGSAPDGHSDFFTVYLLLADELLRSDAEPSRRKQWQRALHSIDPARIYQDSLGKGRVPGNWSALNIAGEFLRFRAGLGGDRRWWESHLPFHLDRFDRLGLYGDGDAADHPTAYDPVAR